jgi:hypothetical protein
MSVAVALVLAAFTQSGLKVDDATRLRYAEDVARAAPTLEVAIAEVVTIKAEAETDPTRIERCDYRKWEGDNGRAVGLFQLHPERLQGHSHDEVCADNGLAAQLAADFLLKLRNETGSWRATFRRYVGVSRQDDPHLRGRDKEFERLLANAKRNAS